MSIEVAPRRQPQSGFVGLAARSLRTVWLVAVLLPHFGITGCSSDTDDVPDTGSASDIRDDLTDSGSPATCSAPQGVDTFPESVSEAVALINALPRPLSLTCFLQVLQRPLHLNATSSPFSAQPADGESSPRMFIMNGPLIMSVTLGTEGRTLLEFSEMQASGRTIKAELPFPVVSEVSAEAPYDNLMFNDDQTRCAICHADERPVFEVNGVTAFESIPFRPHDDSIVDMLRVVELQQDCDSEEDAERCSMLQALVGSPFVEEPFPREFLTMFR